MFFVLPNVPGGLMDVMKRIDLQSLRQDLLVMDQQYVSVYLPKFQFSDQNSFAQALKDLGLRQMFENTASFPGIARGTFRALKRLVVSDVIQKTGIEINEEGAEAFAATGSSGVFEKSDGSRIFLPLQTCRWGTKTRNRTWSSTRRIRSCSSWRTRGAGRYSSWGKSQILRRTASRFRAGSGKYLRCCRSVRNFNAGIPDVR